VIKPHRFAGLRVNGDAGRICRIAGLVFDPLEVDSESRRTVPRRWVAVWKTSCQARPAPRLNVAHIHYLFSPNFRRIVSGILRRPCGNHQRCFTTRRCRALAKEVDSKRPTPLVGILVMEEDRLMGRVFGGSIDVPTLTLKRGEGPPHYTPVTHPTRPPQATAASLPIACQNRGIISRQTESDGERSCRGCSVPRKAGQRRSPPVLTMGMKWSSSGLSIRTSDSAEILNRLPRTTLFVLLAIPMAWVS